MQLSNCIYAWEWTKTKTEYKPASALMSLTCAFLCLVQMRSCSWTALRSVLLTSPRSSGGSSLSFQVTLLSISLCLSLFSHLWDRNSQAVDHNTQIIIIIIMRANVNSELVAYVPDASVMLPEVTHFKKINVIAVNLCDDSQHHQ